MKASNRIRPLPGLLAALLLGACQGTPTETDYVSEPIIHIGDNETNPDLMETAILLVIQAPFDTVRSYVSDPSNIQHYMALAKRSTAEPIAAGDRFVHIETAIVDIFGLSVPGQTIDLRWRPLQTGAAVFAIEFEQVEGDYEHLAGNIYAADLFGGSTAVMLRTTTRTGFVPEAVRERLARWHAEASIRKLTALLQEQASG